MSSFSNATEGDLLKLIFQGAALPWVANSQYFIALHTADPGEVGTQATNEATYTGYARVAIARSAVGFNATGDNTAGWLIASAALVSFGQCTAGTNTLTHISIGLLGTGASQIIMKQALPSSLNVSAGIRPQFQAGDVTAVLD